MCPLMELNSIKRSFHGRGSETFSVAVVMIVFVSFLS